MEVTISQKTPKAKAMIQVFSSPDLSAAYAVKNLLEKSGIAAHVFNESVSRMPGVFLQATPDGWQAVHIADDSR
ncbi:MAG: putative signal transducing protein [Sulfuricaulis sp.]